MVAFATKIPRISSPDLGGRVHGVACFPWVVNAQVDAHKQFSRSQQFHGGRNSLSALVEIGGMLGAAIRADD